MSIRTKMLIIIGTTLVALIAVLYAVSQTILLDSYLTLEQEAVTLNVRRALNATQDEIAFLRRTSLDYAHWDDTYQYIQGLADNYIDVNMYDSVFVNYRLNFVIFVNDDGEIVYGQGFDLVNQERAPLPDSLRTLISHNDAYVRPRAADGAFLSDGVSGIVLLPEGGVMLAIAPIYPSDMQGEPHGALIWGRYFDEQLVQYIAEQTQLTLHVDPVSSDVISILPANDPIVVQAVSADVIVGSVLLRDIDDQPALMLRSDMPRSIYRQGQISVSYFLVALVLVGAISAGAIGVLLQRGVLSRLDYLNRHVSHIQADGDLSSRLHMGGNDELTSLASNFNTMLETLQAQEKLKLARDKALETARLKAEILANVSHDARTPLTIIMLRTDTVLKGIYGSLNTRQSEALNTILISAQQLLGFVNNLLEGAQLDTGRLKLQVEAMQPAKLLETIVTMFEPIAAKKKLLIETQLQDTLPAILYADEKRLEQVVMNLVSNAIKFTDTGSIIIRIYRYDDDHWAIDVKDTGKGISSDHQKQIFSPFWQVDGSTTRAANSGVGLGLSIVYQLTELMGGVITLDSKVGTGSRFTVILPIELSKESTQHGETALRTNS